MSQPSDIAPRYVSIVNEFPEDLYDAMGNFVRSHPHWDQYRLMQVAVAGFLFQQGSRERAVARHYLDGLFDRGAGAQLAGEQQEGRGESEGTPSSITPLRQRPEAPARAAGPRRPVAPPMPHHEAKPPSFRHVA